MKKTKGIREVKFVLVLLTAFIILMFLISVTRAQQIGCCLKTKDGNFCQNDADKNDCEEGLFFTGKSCESQDSCQLVTCIPPEGECQANKLKFECQDLRGRFDARPLAEVEACQEGCVNILGSVCEIMQQKVGFEKAEESGFRKEDVKFTASSTLNECKLQCAGAEKGTCILQGGLCDFTTADVCAQQTGNFIRSVTPSQVNECAIKNAKEFQACGKLEGDENKIFWFNDQGSQEELVKDCNFPQGFCKQLSEEGTVRAECRSSSCEFDLTEKDDEGRKGHKTLLSGTSMCYNFNKDENERSKGLQHQVLHCAFGDVKVEGLGIDRNKICVEDKKGGTARVLTNKWQKCRLCGASGGGFLKQLAGAAFAGYVFGGEPTKIDPTNVAKGDEITVGKQIGTITKIEGDKIFYESGGRNIHETTKSQITKATRSPDSNFDIASAGIGLIAGNNKIGDALQLSLIAIPPGPIINSQFIGSACGETVPLFFDDAAKDFGMCVYEKDFLWDGIGSAVPKINPGSSRLCGSCGAGGDETFNVCEPSECNSLGDCQAEQAFGFDEAFGAWATAAYIKGNIELTECTIENFGNIPAAIACWKEFGRGMSEFFDQTFGEAFKLVGLNPQKIEKSGKVPATTKGDDVKDNLENVPPQQVPASARSYIETLPEIIVPTVVQNELLRRGVEPQITQELLTPTSDISPSPAGNIAQQSVTTATSTIPVYNSVQVASGSGKRYINLVNNGIIVARYEGVG
ncbi:MAG: hypothetical protein AABX59_01580, partial [Nanoarchaeota archaeon]